MRRQLPVVALGCMVALAGALVACSSGDSNGGTVTLRPTLTLAPVQARQLILVNPQGPTGITAEQTANARVIIENDATVREVAAGATVLIERIGGYFYGVDPETKMTLLVGAVAHIKLARAVNHDRITLPYNSVRPFYSYWPNDLQSRYAPFVERTRTYRINNLTEFEINVDFATRRVVKVSLEFGAYGSAQTYEPLDPTPSGPIPNPFLDTPGPDAERIRSIAESFPPIASIKKEHPNGGLAYSYPTGDHHFGYYSTLWEGGVPLEGDWPEIIDQDLVTGDYRSETIHVIEDRANTLHVTVDLDIGQVISIGTQYRD